MMQGILYTGKSEVEETMMAASTACSSAELCCRVAMLSVDIAINPSNSLNIPLYCKSRSIALNPWVQKTSTSPMLDTYLGDIKKMSNKNEEA